MQYGRVGAPRFNTCSSCEEQPDRYYDVQVNEEFQYMLLLRGATGQRKELVVGQMVSIHAPLARSNSPCANWVGLYNWFQYMLLLRGATDSLQSRVHRQLVSIHAPLARSNQSFGGMFGNSWGFNTCSSCEEQQFKKCFICKI